MIADQLDVLFMAAEAFAKPGVPHDLHAIKSADDSASILSMVASGMGVSVLPQLALGNVPRGVTVLELDPPTRRIIGAALPHDANTSARAFASFLCKRMRDANTLSC